MDVNEDYSAYQVMIVDKDGNKLAYKQNDEWFIYASIEQILDRIFESIKSNNYHNY
jgi:Mg2+ and Co2+ transporter CorA